MLDSTKQYTISETAQITDYPPHVLRYYEKEFELDIPRNEVNHRYYTYKEIETFNYIKVLQDRGFTNKQIKLIIKSPEKLIDEDGEVAMTDVITSINNDLNNDLNEKIILNIQKIVVDELEPLIKETNQNNTKLIEELKEEIIILRNDINNKERDVLICENAKLKMKVKEKTYENLELKEQIKEQQNKHKNIFARIFKK